MNETTYTLGTATTEIILLLAGAFALGALCCYLLKALGLCCRRPTQEAHRPQHIQQRPMARALDGRDQEGFETDLHSLLRGRRDENTEPTLARAPTSPSMRPPSSPSPAASRPSSFQSRVEAFTAPVSSLPVNAVLDIPDENHVDDLTKLEGIGPKIERLLNQAGIKSYAKLATMDRDELKALLEAGGSQFKLHEPKSWPYQAELAAKNNWVRLKEYQDFLISGQNKP